MLKIACFGCGVNSVAGLLKYGLDAYDEIIFADTGSEKPETYSYLNWIIKDKKWPITIIDDHYGKSLYDYYFEKKTYPSKVFRTCTSKFKINPLRRYLRKKYGKKETFEMTVYISHEEFHRMKTSDVKYQKLNYPLVYDKIDRNDCLKIIQDAGYKIPIKSGCYMCPFSKKADWSELKVKHPDLFDKSLQLEKQGQKFTASKKMPLLITIRGKETQDLFECDCF
tara:strand:- start:59 stop:730 length:672 start_codon:yes stop_codon:yes gene_type:complete